MADFHESGRADSVTSETLGPFVVDQDSNQLGVFLSGTFTASLAIEISADGVKFAPFGSALTAPGYTALPPCHSCRFINTHTSGTVELRVGGLRKTEQ